jgi:hypothetical protein
MDAGYIWTIIIVLGVGTYLIRFRSWPDWNGTCRTIAPSALHDRCGLTRIGRTAGSMANGNRHGEVDPARLS